MGSKGRSVQELAKEMMVGVPQQYVQAHREPSVVVSHGTSLPTIPIIDMNLLKEEGHGLEKLHSACKEWGIFQLVNHGVCSSLVEKLKHEIEEFYKLPREEKMRYKLRKGDVEGYGQTILHSDQDQKVDWGDRLYMITNPVHRRKPHLLPQLPPSFRNVLESYLSELQKVGREIFGLMGKALKIEEREMEVFENGMQSMRMTYYPPCPRPQLVYGLTPHSDATGITILLQLNQVGGLEIKRDGVWIPVNFLPDAFVVNVGDILEIMSNGAYKSIEHRATVNSVQERISIAVFFNPKFEAEVGPATSIINPQNPPLFKRMGMEKYVKDFFSRKLNGKSFLERLRTDAGEDDHDYNNA